MKNSQPAGRGVISVLAVLSFITLAGISIGVISCYFTSQKKNKSEIPYDGILNIALVPVEIEVTDSIAAVSKELNNPPSLYHLRARNEVDSLASSLPHCTLMHFRIPKDPVKRASLLTRLKLLEGQTILVQINAMESLEANAFIRDELLKGISSTHKMAVKWLAVEKTEALLNLQEKVVNIISDEGAYITGRRDAYKPHFTLWVQEKDSPLEPIKKEAHPLSAQMQHSFFCKVVIGTCGSIGQVAKIFSPK